MRRPRMPPVCHCRLQSPHMAQSVHVKGAFVSVVCCLCVWLSPWAVEPMKWLRSLSHHHPTTVAPAPCLYSTQYLVHSGLLLLLPYHVTILLRPCCCCCFSPLSLSLWIFSFACLPSHSCLSYHRIGFLSTSVAAKFPWSETEQETCSHIIIVM